MQNFGLEKNNFLFRDSYVDTDPVKDRIISEIFDFTLKETLANKNIYFVNDHYVYKTMEEEYTFFLLSDYIVDPHFKNLLQTSLRARNCHTFSLDFSMQNPNYQVVTGYIKAFDKKYLHSVSKTYFPILQKEVYLDFTTNTIMDTDTFTKLFSFEILEELQQEDILNFQESIKNYYTSFNEKLAVCFAKEVTNDLKRNRVLFDKK